MFTSPDEVAAYIRDNDVKFVDVRFCDLPGVMQHFTVPASIVRRGRLHRRAGASTARRSAGSRRSTSPTCCCCRTRRRAFLDPFRDAQDAEHQLLHPRPAHRRGLQPRPAQRRQEGRGVPGQHRHRRHRVLRPRGGVLHLRRRPLRDQAATRATTTSTPSRAAWNTGRDEEGGNRGYKPRYKGGYFPVAAVRPLRRPARRDGRSNLDRRRPRGRARPPRGRHRRPGRDQLQVRHAAARRPTS